jgi:hypothetical protein
MQEQTTPGPAGAPHHPQPRCPVADRGTSDSPPQRPREPRKVIHAWCSVHQGAVGFTNLVVSKRNGQIELNPHADGSCLLTLSEDEACALRDVLIEWLG